jgi:hypothetical protein
VNAGGATAVVLALESLIFFAALDSGVVNLIN